MSNVATGEGRWPTRRLGDVLLRHNEIIHPGDRENGEATLVGLEHIEPNTGRRIGSLTIDLGKLTGRKPTFRRDQIVYGYLRPYLNKVWIAEFDGCSSVDQFAFDVRPDLADTNFIAAFMRSETFLRRSRVVTTTGQLPRISVDEVAAVPIELPPIADQRRIAAELQTSLVAADAARHAAKERLAAAEALPAAYLREVFERSEAGRWDELTLSALVRRPIRTGLSKPGGPTSNKRCLTLSAVRERTLLLEASKPVDVSDADAEGNWLEPGCFYVVRGNGNRDLVGRGAFAPDVLPDRMLFPDLLFRLDLNEAVDPKFFWYLWCSAPVRREIESRARTAAGIYKINTSNLNSLPLRLPAIGEQRLLAHDLSFRVEAADSLIARCRAELAAITAFPAAVLRTAFNGES
ncbi:MAG: hypothetical protein ABI665_19525 [Vicinamibacterales bacterium]